MILLIDHYDSFSFNLYQLVGSLSSDIKVIRSDELTVKEIENLNPSHIILSPGTGRPESGYKPSVTPVPQRISRTSAPIPVMGFQSLGSSPCCTVHNWCPASRFASGGNADMAFRLSHIHRIGFIVNLYAFRYKRQERNAPDGRMERGARQIAPGSGEPVSL